MLILFYIIGNPLFVKHSANIVTFSQSNELKGIKIPKNLSFCTYSLKCAMIFDL